MKARTPTTPRGQSTPQRKFPRTTDGVHRTTFSLTLSARCESLGPGVLGVLTAAFALAMQAFDPSHADSSRPRSISVSTDDLAGMAKAQQPPNGYFPPPMSYPYAEGHYPYGSPGAMPGPAVYHPPHPYPYPIYHHDAGMYASPDSANAAGKGFWRYAAPHPPQVEYFLPSVARPAPFMPPMTPLSGPSGRPLPRQVPEPSAHGHAATSPSNPYGDRRAAGGGEGGDLTQASPRAPGAKNILDIAAIENGTDTRTTVMIKNIPNKMTDKDLKAFIDKVCPRRIDFMYLRMDFQNGEWALI